MSEKQRIYNMEENDVELDSELGSGIDSSSDAVRLGERMRRIRTALGMTQGELGAKIGLSADRVQKYENGFRKPKADMLGKIADALGVEKLALTDPIVTTPIGVMYALFEMEREYNAVIRKTSGGFEMTFVDTVNGTAGGSINDYLLEWTIERDSIEESLRNAVSVEEKKKIGLEYDMWKWTFPRNVSGMIDTEKRKKILKEKIELLQLELSKLS